jgi:hypothetical protein
VRIEVTAWIRNDGRSKVAMREETPVRKEVAVGIAKKK